MVRFLLAHREVITEAVTISCILAVVLFMPQRSSKWLGAVERAISHVAVRRRLSVPLVGLFALGASAAPSLVWHLPYPSIHDEFSYLLAADTFASGRLTNPTHPMWLHFESFHIIQQPSYASKYPPAQGLILALGQVISGFPIVGVWISMGLAYAATFWMMLAWVPAWVAMVGIFLASLHPRVLLDWGWSYLGGAVAMMGGALVFGALRRVLRQPRRRDALLLGIGLAVLANSRPFEGLVVSLPVAVVLFAWMAGKGDLPLRVSIGRVGLPILGVLTLAVVAMVFYNSRVTGHPLRMPYLVHEQTYAVAPVFIWQHPRPEPTYHHQVMRDFYLGWALDAYTLQRTAWGLLEALKTKLRRLWTFYEANRNVRLPLTIPLLMVPWGLRHRWSRFALFTCALLAAGLLMETWLSPHYAAPIVSLVFVILLQGLRHLRLWRWRGRPLGQAVVWALVLVGLASFPQALGQRLRAMPNGWPVERAHIIAQLKQRGGHHLIIVRYGPSHSSLDEWVYNEADIDGAQVVWAREMDAAHNQALLEYFKDRHVWRLEVDGSRLSLHSDDLPIQPRQ